MRRIITLAIAATIAVSGASTSFGDSSEFPERDALRAKLADELGLEFIKSIRPRTDMALLAVDLQRSFTVETSALYVPGSESDIETIDAFVRRNMGRFLHAWYTMDTHPRYYVGSDQYLQDAEGNPPPLFVDIDPSLMLDGTYRPRNPHHRDRVASYARCLLDQGLFWNVWPDHGVQGSEQWSLHSTIDALFNDYTAHWSDKTARAPDPMIVYKAANPHTEQFGAVEAVCPNEDPSTQRQDLWLDEIRAHVARGGVVIAFGEAINFCVSGTLIPLIRAGIPGRSIILAYDASSPIPAFEQRTVDALAEFRELGGRFTLLEKLRVEGRWRLFSMGQPEMGYTLPAP